MSGSADAEDSIKLVETTDVISEVLPGPGVMKLAGLSDVELTVVRVGDTSVVRLLDC